MSATQGVWTCRHGVDGRDWCADCHVPALDRQPCSGYGPGPTTSTETREEATMSTTTTTSTTTTKALGPLRTAIATNALREFVDAVDATGGVVDTGIGYVPIAMEGGLIDIGDAYVHACRALDREPKVAA